MLQPAGSDCVSEKASWVPEPLEKHTGELAVTNSKVPHREDGGVSVFTERGSLLLVPKVVARASAYRAEVESHLEVQNDACVAEWLKRALDSKTGIITKLKASETDAKLALSVALACKKVYLAHLHSSHV